MKVEQYQEEVKRTLNTYLNTEDQIINCCFGIAGESGEIVDYMKKYFYQFQELDKDRLKEEIGDLMWYIANLCNCMKLQLNDIFDKNIEKLKKRYPNGFETCFDKKNKK